MIPIKIQCGCGQRYAFEVEPVNGRMPGAIACPVCNIDGTEAANAVIAVSLPRVAVAAPPAAEPRMRVATAVAAAPAAVATAPAVAHATAPSPRAPAQLSGQISREQAEVEAKAKIFWGDAQDEVIKYLMIQGFKVPEASALVRDLFQQRVKTIKSNGFKKICLGILLLLVPLGAFLVFLHIGVFPLMLFALTIMVGLYGLWLLLKGTIMLVSPKSEPGEVEA